MILFVNFTALPSMAVMFDWEIPSLNTNINEEEVKNNFANFNEKFPPNPYFLKDFFENLSFDKSNNSFILKDDPIHLSPFISIFSPPPEV